MERRTQSGRKTSETTGRRHSPNCRRLFGCVTLGQFPTNPPSQSRAVRTAPFGQSPLQSLPKCRPSYSPPESDNTLATLKAPQRVPSPTLVDTVPAMVVVANIIVILGPSSSPCNPTSTPKPQPLGRPNAYRVDLDGLNLSQS